MNACPRRCSRPDGQCFPCGPYLWATTVPMMASPDRDWVPAREWRSPGGCLSFRPGRGPMRVLRPLPVRDGSGCRVVDRGAEDVGIAERGRAVGLRGWLGDRRAAAQRQPPRVQGRTVGGPADIVPHADRAGAVGGGVHVVAEELRLKVVLRRRARVTDRA